MPSTYAAPIKYVPTAHTANQGGAAVTLPFEAIISGRNIIIDWEDVPTASGTRESIIKVNSAIYGRRWFPQPFANALIELFEGSDVMLPEGYVGKDYDIDWIYQSDPAVSFFDGTIPPGLGFTPISLFEWTITGIPTTVGSYTFQLKVIVGVTVGFITFHIPILPGEPTGTPPVWGEFEFPQAYTGIPYEFQWFLESISFPCTYSLIAGKLPPQFVLETLDDLSLGQVSGTGSLLGDYTFTLRATNSEGSADREFTIRVAPDPNEGAGYIYGN